MVFFTVHLCPIVVTFKYYFNFIIIFNITALCFPYQADKVGVGIVKLNILSVSMYASLKFSECCT